MMWRDFNKPEAWPEPCKKLTCSTLEKPKDGDCSSEMLQSRDTTAVVDWNTLQPQHLKAQEGYTWLYTLQETFLLLK